MNGMKIIPVIYLFDDELFCESILKSLDAKFEKIVIMIGANKYTKRHWATPDCKPIDRTCEIVEHYIHNRDKFILQYNEYKGTMPFGQMKGIGYDIVKSLGGEWYFEIDAGEIYFQKDLDSIIKTINEEGDRYKLFQWKLFTFYPDFSSGYEWGAGELRCFKILPTTKFWEDRRAAFLYDGSELLWPLSGNKPMNIKWGKFFNFYCYHLDDLKPPINQFHRFLRRKLYKLDKEYPTYDIILQVLYEMNETSREVQRYMGDYPEYLDNINLMNYKRKGE